MFQGPPKLKPATLPRGVLRVRAPEGGCPRVEVWSGNDWLHVPAITALTIKIEATDIYPTTSVHFDALAIVDIELRPGGVEAFDLAKVPAWIKTAAKLQLKWLKLKANLSWHFHQRWTKK